MLNHRTLHEEEEEEEEQEQEAEEEFYKLWPANRTDQQLHYRVTSLEQSADQTGFGVVTPHVKLAHSAEHMQPCVLKLHDKSQKATPYTSNSYHTYNTSEPYTLKPTVQNPTL